MKFRQCVFTGLCLAGLAFSGGKNVLAFDQSQAASVSDSSRQMMISEYGKNVLAENAAGFDPKRPAHENYDRERDQIASQLTVYTENEDTKAAIVEGDTLTISYRDRDQVNRAAYKVNQAGEIFIPVCGSVKVAGLGRRQARDRVEQMIKEYIREPKCVMTVNTDGKVMVFGAVMAPGVLDIKPQWTLLEAILSAGGFNRQTAELGSIIVMRGAMDKRTVLKLNLKKLVTKGDAADNICLKPGDFVYVPMSFISNLDAFLGATSKYLMWWYGLGGAQPVSGNSWEWGSGGIGK
jgi:protein involved in polysaccharide export with SLBB domain